LPGKKCNEIVKKEQQPSRRLRKKSISLPQPLKGRLISKVSLKRYPDTEFFSKLLDSLLDGSRSRNLLGRLRRLAARALAAIGAYYLGILVGHFVQEGGKRLAAVIA
jgi:hypothetical protein